MGNKPTHPRGRGSKSSNPISTSKGGYGGNAGVQGGGRGPRSTGGGPGGGGGTGGKPHTGGDSSCSMWAPVAVVLLPYALARLALDTWRGRHA